MHRLVLLQIFFDKLSFSEQIRDELFIGIHKAREGFHVGAEFFGKTEMFLVSPGLPQVT